jgi:precorrin-3B C17-methyltransferase
MGKMVIAGFGPGNAGNITAACDGALRGADIIVGYAGYVKLLRPLYPKKIFYESGMTQEAERCAAAIRFVRDGKTVCVVSGGDGGVYGMASLIFELAGDDPGFDVEVVPGVTAAISGAALLGAPLSNDFAVVSLSDLLTPWETVEKRLRAAVAGDFVICIYNPGSKTRTEHLRAACDIILESAPADRLCGVTRNIGRDGQFVSLMTLDMLRELPVGMTDTVFIGNSQTERIGGRMVTPRGYGIV